MWRNGYTEAFPRKSKVRHLRGRPREFTLRQSPSETNNLKNQALCSNALRRCTSQLQPIANAGAIGAPAGRAWPVPSSALTNAASNPLTAARPGQARRGRARATPAPCGARAGGRRARWKQAPSVPKSPRPLPSQASARPRCKPPGQPLAAPDAAEYKRMGPPTRASAATTSARPKRP